MDLFPTPVELQSCDVTNRNLSNPLILLFVLTSFLAITLLTWAFSTGGLAWKNGRNQKGNVTIPGPRGLPLFGSLFSLSSGLAHRTLACMASSQAATQLMAFSLGSTPAIVTSDPQIAREILTSPHFADRPIKQSAKSLMFSRAIGFAPNGAYWRLLRRIASTHLFAPRRIAMRSLIVLPSKNVSENADFVHVLLSLEGEEKLDEDDMVAVLWEMIFRGTDTTALLTEWVMAELVLNPKIQAELRNELNFIVGNRSVEDADVAKLPYLQAVIKETLRVHPPGPLLSWARLSTSDVHLSNGMVVPTNTTAMVNMWAITHDPRVWEDALVFKPERFLERQGGADVDVRGVDLRLAPFGAGVLAEPRACSSEPMGG
uniref:Cytochrome P450 n=1 Tax=Salix viminalis TaxID=40686 RepID=A0A6N2NHP8_SALVM